MTTPLASSRKPGPLAFPHRLSLVVAVAAALLMANGTTTIASADAAASWDKHCASCHGKDGKGKTKMGEKLKVRDLTDAAVKAKLNKTNVTDSMKKGVKEPGSDKLVMKSYSDKLTDAEIQELTDYTLGLK